MFFSYDTGLSTTKQKEMEIVESYHSPYISLKITHNADLLFQKEFVASLDTLPEQLKDVLVGMKEGEKKQVFISDEAYEVTVLKTDKTKLNRIKKDMFPLIVK